MLRKAALTLILATSLAACQTGGNKEIGGTLLGAGAGAALGSQFGKGKGRDIAMVVGALAGAFAGNKVGQSLDRADQQYNAQTTQNALEYQPSGTSSNWVNPDTGRSGSVVPQAVYQNNQGQTCRDYENTIIIDGRAETARGTACRQADGVWRIVQ